MRSLMMVIALPGDGDYTETCWSIFKVKFKAFLLCIFW